ncbi:MAG: histidine kinase [Algicola sp.]|nr:histidine kinase [Algicola sp.]
MLYWTLQIVGWAVYGLVSYLMYANSQSALPNLIILVTLLLGGGLLITHALRFCYKRPLWQGLGPVKAISGYLVVLIVATVLWETIITLTSFWLLPEFTWQRFSWFLALIYFVYYFIILLVWTLLYKGYHAYRATQRQEIESLKLQLALRESQLQGLKFQMNPHFLFNALNSIRSLALESPEATRDMVTRLSGMLRYTLTSGDLKLVALGEEVAILKHYLAIEKVRFEERLQVNWAISPDLENWQVLPLSIQTLVENAVKHGISVLPKGGTIDISITERKAQLLVEISNIGRLPVASLSKGIRENIGLRNTRERLALQFGNNAELSLNQVGDKVVARMFIPK